MKRILLVEDDFLSQRFTQILLSDMGFQVDVAPNSSSAVECASGYEYALILMDIGLPDKDGFETAKLIRKMPKHQNTPIVALTAHAGSDDASIKELGAIDDMVCKPVNERILSDIVSAI